MITIKRFLTYMTILLIVCIGCMYWIYHSRQVEINHLQAEVNILYNYKLSQPSLKAQIINLEAENNKLTILNDRLKITTTADKLYIDKLESDYLLCITYANVAEAILLNNGINFTRIEQ